MNLARRIAVIAAAILAVAAVTLPASATTRHFMGFGSSAACAGPGSTGAGTGCSGSTSRYPLSVSYCASAINLYGTERRPANTTADHTQGPAAGTANWGPWATGQAGIWHYWHLAAGHFTGTTDEVMEMAACRWGWNENWIRAEAVRESSWYQSQQGDYASGCYHSFSIIQIRDSRNSTCPIDHDAWGGMPYTQASTPLALDAFGSYMRSCLDGLRPTSFYNGKTVAQWAAANGWSYVRWGCVGSWFSGDWYSTAAQDYISRVQTALADRTWDTY